MALDCTQPTSRTLSPRLSTATRECRKSAAASAQGMSGSRQAQSVSSPALVSSRAPAAAAPASASSAASSAAAAPGRSSESSFSSRQ